MKKPVKSSNLALRFYKHDLWTRECLEKYIVRGELLDTEIDHNDKPEIAYFLLRAGGAFDCKRLLEEEVSKVIRTFDDNPNQTDLQFLEYYNW